MTSLTVRTVQVAKFIKPLQLDIDQKNRMNLVDFLM